MTESKETQIGIVAFIDILGYSNFLENNEPENAALIVLPFLTDIPNKVKEIHMGFYEKENIRRKVEEQYSKIIWLIFSDTIVLVHPYTSDSDNLAKTNCWLYTLNSLVFLYRHLFDGGLPVRGCVSFGRFFVKDYCFAGRSLIKAHKETNTFDLSVIVVDNLGIEELNNIQAFQTQPSIKRMLNEYLLPLNDGSAKKYNVLPPSVTPNPFTTNDFRQMVTESFCKHGKDIAPKVISKLNNTEIFFRFMKIKYPKMFKEQ